MRLNLRFIIALVIAAVTLIGYFFNTSVNPVTGEKQHVNMSAAQEISLGLQAAPQMAAEYGGESPDSRATAAVQQVGQRLVAANNLAQKTSYRYQFHLLADDQTINAFALPGGQIFITMGILKNLKTESELAGVLAHEIGHVVGRHSAEQVSKS
jgi:predicted Zn-dependent protease